MITFNEAIRDADMFVVSPDTKREVCGYFTNARVDRKTLPSGWYAYDIRHGDTGNFCTMEPLVVVNHAGTFLCQKEVTMNKDGVHWLSRGAGYTFA